MGRITALLDRPAGRLVPALALCLALGGCSYYAHLAAGQFELWQRREPIEPLLADSERDAQLRQQLAAALRARAYASAELGLPDNASYRLYVELERPYALWNVFATPEFSLAAHQRCFPLAGCVAYQGFFQQPRAQAEAARLQALGYDTQVAGIAAYSTLGWFDDPLTSAMLGGGDGQLAGLIFHELAHQQLYLPGDTAFSESYASFVERRGLAQWRRVAGLPPPSAARQQAYRQLLALVQESRERLDALYASELPAEAKRQAKAAVFTALRRDYRRLRDEQWNGQGYFDGWVERPLNNASLLPLALYDRWVPAFSALFARAGCDWPRFHAAAGRLAAQPTEARERRLQRLAAEAPQVDSDCAASQPPSAR